MLYNLVVFFLSHKEKYGAYPVAKVMLNETQSARFYISKSVNSWLTFFEKAPFYLWGKGAFKK